MAARRAALTLLLILIAALAASCGDDDGADQVAGTSGGDDMCPEDDGVGPYFLYENEGWDFRSGADYPAGTSPLGRVEPSLDWFVEYERFTPSSDGTSVEGVSLRVSGHAADVDSQRGELLGFRTEDAEVAGRSGYTGVSPEGEPTVVSMAVEDGYTVMLLSYGLALDDLTQVASAIERVCQSGWVEAGGRVLTCDPLDPDCNPPSSSTSVPSSTTSLRVTTTTGP